MAERLEGELVRYFTEVEHRGRNCRIDCLRSGDDEIFFTYAEDHPDTDLLWLDGQLKPHVLSKSFRLIFKHNNSRRSLDIHIEGSREVVPDLQVIFAEAVLGEEIARDAPKDEQIYALDEILTPGFQLIHPDELGIADARITKMRFRLIGEPWRRFMAEADVSANRDALTDFVENLTMRLPRSRLQLDQVCIAVKFHKRAGDRRPPSRQVFITYPNSLRLKHDELGASIVQMLVHSGIERMSDDDYVDQDYRRALETLLARISEPGARARTAITADDAARWPHDAVRVLVAAGVLRASNAAASIVCYGCEERCLRQVIVLPAEAAEPERAAWTCDLFSDKGPFVCTANSLQRWSMSRNALAKFIGRLLGLKIKSSDREARQSPV